MNKLSHKTITKVALKDFFSEESVLEKLKNDCILPDIDENQEGYVHHFYNPVTNTNYFGSEDSAKARCICHFGKYLINNNIEELARSIHFLEDICTPVHTQYEDTTDAIIRSSLHLEFEKSLDNFLKDYIFSDDDIDCHANLYMKTTINDLVKYCSLESAKNYYLYRDKKQKNQSIQNTAKLAYHAIKCFGVNFINPNKKSATIIKDKTDKDIGVLVKYSYNLHKQSYQYYDVAPLNFSYRFRIKDKEIFIFKKVNILKNFVLERVLKI